MGETSIVLILSFDVVEVLVTSVDVDLIFGEAVDASIILVVVIEIVVDGVSVVVVTSGEALVLSVIIDGVLFSD
uniref:Uncharacterized protein n=1 Tax=Strongyloides stercoralis TaxID=6248 RepID=A0A0K0ED59_STRER